MQEAAALHAGLPVLQCLGLPAMRQGALHEFCELEIQSHFAWVRSLVHKLAGACEPALKSCTERPTGVVSRFRGIRRAVVFGEITAAQRPWKR